MESASATMKCLLIAMLASLGYARKVIVQETRHMSTPYDDKDDPPSNMVAMANASFQERNGTLRLAQIAKAEDRVQILQAFMSNMRILKDPAPVHIGEHWFPFSIQGNDLHVITQFLSTGEKSATDWEYTTDKTSLPGGATLVYHGTSFEGLQGIKQNNWKLSGPTSREMANHPRQIEDVIGWMYVSPRLKVAHWYTQAMYCNDAGQRFLPDGTSESQQDWRMDAVLAGYLEDNVAVEALSDTRTQSTGNTTEFRSRNPDFFQITNVLVRMPPRMISTYTAKEETSLAWRGKGLGAPIRLRSGEVLREGDKFHILKFTGGGISGVDRGKNCTSWYRICTGEDPLYGDNKVDYIQGDQLHWTT